MPVLSGSRVCAATSPRQTKVGNMRSGCDSSKRDGSLAAMLSVPAPASRRHGSRPGAPRLLVRTLPQRQALAGAGGERAFVDCVAEHDIADRETAVPEGDALVRALAARPGSRRDLADLGVDAGTGQVTRLDQRLEGAALGALVPIVDAEFIRERVTGSEFAVIEGAGHMPNLERADEFNQTVHRFLARLREQV